ncbi:MAG: TRAP transporter permease [Deltaproteobacteria bacterium]|nr:TRAP transporter permease [Deltaproteobacteria bacterium]MBW2306702.1 TRAP transporter permease [Deltaproteobacteria bacterium]
MRELSGPTKKIIIAITASASFFHLYTAATGVLEPRLQRGFHLLFLVPLAFLLFPMTRRSPRDRIPWYDWFLAILSALPSLYIILDKDRLNERWEGATEVTTFQIVVGAIIVLTLIEAVRRSTAPALAMLIVLALVHLIFGHHLPGFLYHKKFSLDWVIETCYLLDDEGIYGSITGVSAVFVALFVIFGAFIHGLGLGQYFIDVACRLAGRTAGGPAKVAVISSAFFGTISGAASANVFATGTFSIPLMRRIGYRAQFAGAVEAAASTGGQLMPPIMGAAAFLMAQITQIPYITICKAALPAAVLYFLCIGTTVHYEALKRGLSSMDIIDVSPIKTLIRDFYLILPIVVLLALMVIGYSPFMGAFVGTLVTLGISFFSRSRWMTPLKILRALDMGGRNLVMIACACAGAGLIISVVVNTGLGLQFSNVVISYSGGYYLVAMIFIMVSAIILGMGLPTTAAYVLAVSVGGPTLIEMGGDVLSVHLFVFYFAIMACVTPPVALAAYAGASLAGTDPLRTGFEASRIAVAGYIIPYLFYFSKGILLKGSFQENVLALMSAAVGIYILVIGLQGWMLTRLNMVERAILVAGAIVIPFPILFSNLQSVPVGLALIASFYFLQRNKREKAATAQPKET